MNAIDLLQRLWTATLALSAALVIVAALRTPWRRWFGVEHACRLWWLPLFALIASQLPHAQPHVVVTIVPGATGGTTKSKPAAGHVAEVLKRLKGLKSAKPATLKTLQSSLKSWFKPALKPDEVASVIAALQNSKKISVNGTKVVYALG